jgi:archaeosine synthase
MQFEVKKRDGSARIGFLTINSKKIVTPNIVYTRSRNIEAPRTAEIVITKEPSRSENVSPVQIQSLGSFFYKAEKSKFVDTSISASLVYPYSLPDEFHVYAFKENKANEWYVVSGKKLELLKKICSKGFILANASAIYSKSRDFVKTIVSIRENIGYQKILYLPAVAKPSNIALLAYMGIDLFDNISAILAARKDYLFSITDIHKKEDLHEKFCSCPACISIDNIREMDFNKILEHNHFVLDNEIRAVRNAVKNGRLRELVETRIGGKPELVEKLRILEQEHYEYLEKNAPIYRKTPLLAISLNSLWRPEIVRFRKRVLERYSKPNSKKILLLLPCSAKKPYRISRSHRIFQKVIEETGNPAVIHEVIVTSPLGIVPRELDIVYPANVYDIPVTGHWFDEEKKMIMEQLENYLEINTYDQVISHLPNDLHETVQHVVNNAYHTCVYHPLSKNSLEKLSKTLKNLTKNYDRVEEKEIDSIKCVAQYQFGKDAAEMLLENCKVTGRSPYHNILHNNKQIGVISRDRGLISLTIYGAEKLFESSAYWVEIEKNIELKGSVLAVGVKDADENIRVGDEVVVRDENNNLQAVGIAEMNGYEMKESNRGIAVKLRHHKTL